MDDIEVLIDYEDRDLISFSWSISNGYVIRNVYRTDLDEYVIVKLSRLVLERKLGREIKDGMECDHINRIRLDNRRENLREVTHSTNMRNRSLFRNNKSGYTGICKHGRGFESHIMINGRQMYLGTFDTAEGASDAYQKAIPND